MCKFLESQNFIVICSILSIFRNHQKINRSKFDNYFQIFLKTELSKVKKRNNKNIYFQPNAVGTKIKFPPPYKNDLVIKNNFLPYKKEKIDQIVKKINNVKKNKK